MILKKLKLIYDASIVVNTTNANWARSGVYFSALNLLKEFAKRDDIELVLYCKTDDKNKAKKFLKDLLKKDFACIFEFVPSKLIIALKRAIEKLPPLISKPFYKANDLRKKLKNKNTQKKPNTQNPNEYNACYLSAAYDLPARFKHDESIIKYAIAYDVMPLIFPQYYKDSVDGWLQTFKIFNNYFSISRHTKKDYLKHLEHLKEQNITTALLACDESFKPANNEQINLAKQKYKIPENTKYIFSLCTLEPRKNLIRTLKTFIEFIKKNNIDDLVFVLGGGHWEIFIKELEKSINDLGAYKDKILKIGYVDDKDLAPLYSGALFFVYTSQYEGFGLPPLEAMSCGSAVITSDNSSLPEVVGDAGIMIAYDSDEAHIKAYEKYYFDENFRKENAKKGLERSGLFSWQKCADIMVNKMKQDLKF